MSDVLNEVNPPIPIEDIESSILEVVAEVQSLSENESPPASSRVPTEILHHIYQYLSPKHFDTARHTCRHWLQASLDKRLLRTMLKRGGWWSGAEIQLMQQPNLANGEPSTANLSEIRCLSRILTRECSLSRSFIDHRRDASPDPYSGIFTEVSTTDFVAFVDYHSRTEKTEANDLVYNFSICGQFLLVGCENSIYIYVLRDGRLVPATRVVCPRRILTMAMDVSSGRYAIAILLEGRMGMVCELQSEVDSPLEVSMESFDRPYEHVIRSGSLLPMQTNGFEAGINATSQSPIFMGGVPSSKCYVEAVDAQSNYQALSSRGIHDQRTHKHSHIGTTSDLRVQGSGDIGQFKDDFDSHLECAIPTENGPSTFYRHLCSEDDPPRSVSICPQRCCVAFGCSAGIELHWIDALTTQSFNRWFPLTTPSDYLYFLAPRPGFESAKKLRLISSPAHPDDRPSITRKFFSDHPTVSTIWSSLGFDSNSRRLTSSLYDHYHAVPLSDGHHILFIDPQTGRLSLGCDAPFGGPVKLLRRIEFVPPSLDNATPRLYTSALDMSWGARVVAVYGDTLVFYSIPPDVCNLSRTEQKPDSWDLYTAPPFWNEVLSADHWLNWWEEPSPADRADKDLIWPITIRGQEIGKFPGVCEVAVQTKPALTVWGCSVDKQ